MDSENIQEPPSEPVKQWPKSVLEFTGFPDMPPFESGRDELLPPCEDPFSSLCSSPKTP